MFWALIKRDFLLNVVRGTSGLWSLVLYAMALVLFSFAGDLNPSHVVFLLLLLMGQNFSDGLVEDYRYGFFDMIVAQKRGFHTFLWSKLLVSWVCIGGAFSLMTAFVLGMQGFYDLKVLGVLLLLTFMVCLIALMLSSLMLGARSFKGGLFIFAMPIYVPLYLFALWAVQSLEDLSLKTLALLTMALLLFYGPLCLGIAGKALREAVKNK